MTAANGLGALAAYTREAAAAVAAQKGAVPDTAPGGPDVGGPGGAVPNPGASVVASASPSASPWKPGLDMPSAFTRAGYSSLAGWAFPVALLVTAVGLLVAMVTPAGVTLRTASRVRRRLLRLAELRRRE